VAVSTRTERGRPDYTTVRIIVEEVQLADAIAAASVSHPLKAHQGGMNRSEVVREALTIGLAVLARQYHVPAAEADLK